MNSPAVTWEEPPAVMSDRSEYLPPEIEATEALPVPPKTKPLAVFIDAAAFVAEPLHEPPALVHGVLHQGSKLVLGGGRSRSKPGRSWTWL